MIGSRNRRSAFTMVELLVVILIIAILVSLISSAVMRAMNKIPEITTRTEISQMDIALQAFMTDYNLTEPPPSTLILNELAPLLTPADGGQSARFLQQVFGKNLGPTDWNGDGAISGMWLLEGEQCLVFYLGGIPATPGVAGFNPQGFSTNNMKPSYGSMPALGETMGKRKGPYYNFQIGRLVPIQSVSALPSATLLSPSHPVYVDGWQVKLSSTLVATHPAPLANGIPYAYFSSKGVTNGYTVTDCQSLVAAPYFVIPLGLSPQYTYPNKYQIISAGKDGTFGNAGWVPASGAIGTGADDQANFSGSVLGAGQS